jgi:DNA-binding Lrp family transcriptional regulator
MPRMPVRATNATVRLDDIDRRIVALLQADARRSARALAREISMSPGAVSERITRLENAGVIRGYHADVDPVALGLSLHVIIGLQIQQEPSLDDIIAVLLKIPEVVGVHVVSGQLDLIVIAQVRDSDHMRELVLDRLWRTPGFRHSETMLILDSYEKRVSPLGSYVVGSTT